MTKQQIEQQLKNQGLSNHEREQLRQLLHYMQVEGVVVGQPAQSQHKKSPAVHRPRNTA